MWGPHMGPGYGYSAWYQFLQLLVPLLVFGALIGLLVWAVMRLTRERPPAPPGRPMVPPPDAALAEVRMRYARGEIGRDEFVRVSQDLGGAATEPPPPAPEASPPAAEPPSA